MGLTIHYSGRINPSASLSEMIEEVKDIAEIYGWDYKIYDEKFPKGSFGKDVFDNNIYGIYFTPPNCESICLTFLSNGRLCSPHHLEMYLKYSNPNEKPLEFLYYLFTKTQYAGIQTHMLVIHLLKHLSKKYLLEFSVKDEGHYWETGDENILKENFKQYNEMIGSFTSAFKNVPMKDGENFEIYFLRIVREIDKKRKKKSDK